MIIGISGKKGSGKTVIAKHLRSCMGATFIRGFFSGAKELYCQTMEAGLSPSSLDFQNIKDSVHSSGKARRVMLQEYGCAMRAIWEDVWVSVWTRWVRERCRNSGCHILVPDVRFPNEVKAIQDLGGKVLRLTRCPQPEDRHESETALDWMLKDRPVDLLYDEESGKYYNLQFDSILVNDNSTIDQQNEMAWGIIKEWIGFKDPVKILSYEELTKKKPIHVPPFETPKQET